MSGPVEDRDDSKVSRGIVVVERITLRQGHVVRCLEVREVALHPNHEDGIARSYHPFALSARASPNCGSTLPFSEIGHRDLTTHEPSPPVVRVRKRRVDDLLPRLWARRREYRGIYGEACERTHTRGRARQYAGFDPVSTRPRSTLLRRHADPQRIPNSGLPRPFAVLLLNLK